MKRSCLLKLIDENLMNQLYQFCYARTAHSYEAEDLCSDILCAVVKSSHIDKEVANPMGYFWSVARNIYAEYCEKRHVQTEHLLQTDSEEVLLRIPDTTDNYVEENETERELLEVIFQHIANLSRAYRSVMIGFYLDGKSTAQLSQELGVSESAIRQRLFSARNDIKNGVKKMNDKKIVKKPTVLDEMQWTVWGGGSPVDGDPRDVCVRQFSKHIVWLCRNKANTARSIADELGVPMTYVEEELDIQVNGTNGRYGTLRKTDTGKYVINFVLLDKREIQQLQQLYIDYIPMICDNVIKHIKEYKREYLAFPYINKMPTLNLILWQQVRGMADVFAACVEEKLKNKYLADVKISERPFSIFGYQEYEGAKDWGGGWDGVTASDLCGYKHIRIDNVYMSHIKAHFHCECNISNDEKLRMAIRAIEGLSVDELDEKEKEIAARAIECGYLYREDRSLFTKFLVHKKDDGDRLFAVNELMRDSFEETADGVAKKIADFVKRNIPEYLRGDYNYINWLANLPVLDTLVDCLIEQGILTPPENGVGAEGIWMSVEK